MINPVFRIVIEGNPVGKERPRSNFHTPKKTRDYEARIKEAARNLFIAPLTGPIKLKIAIFSKPPVHLMKVDKEAWKKMWNVSTPDFDNVTKAISDGLNECAWKDDCQVCDFALLKMYHIEPCVIFEISECDLTPIEAYTHFFNKE